MKKIGSPGNLPRNGRPRITFYRDKQKIMSKITIYSEITAQELKKIKTTNIFDNNQKLDPRKWIKRLRSSKNQIGRYG